MDISCSERGGNRSQSCYSTATNPRIGKTTRCLSSSPGLQAGGFFNRSSGSRKGADPPPLPYSLPPLPNLTSQLSLRLPEESGSTFSLHQHQQPLNHPNLHLTSRRIASAFSGRSEASSVFPSSTVSGGPASVSGSHSRSMLGIVWLRFMVLV